MDIKKYGRETGSGAVELTKWLIWTFVWVFGLAEISFILYMTFAPMNEQVRYNVYKQSQTYNDGMLRDLEDLYREYQAGTPEQKAALMASSFIVSRSTQKIG